MTTVRSNYKALVLAILAGLAITIGLAAPAQAGSGTSLLRAGETLLPGQYLINDTARLVMQRDGNLVLYINYDSPHRRACAASHSTAHPGSRAWMSPNGVFSVYTPQNAIVWTTAPRTTGWGPGTVGLSYDGVARVRSASFQNVFAFWTC